MNMDRTNLISKLTENSLMSCRIVMCAQRLHRADAKRKGSNTLVTLGITVYTSLTSGCQRAILCVSLSNLLRQLNSSVMLSKCHLP